MRAIGKIAAVLVVLAVMFAGAWWWAGRAPGPQIQIRQPSKMIGLATPFEIAIDAPRGRLARAEVSLEQNGKAVRLFTLDPAAHQSVRQESADRVVMTGFAGKRDSPDLEAGPARIVVHAARPVFFGLRQIAADAAHDVIVRLDPPRVSSLSTFHYVNQGGAEFVVYRASPPDVESGVRVGELTYPGFPAAGAGIKGDESLRVAFFALLHDQDPNAPIVLYARDEGGIEATAALDHRVFPKPFAHSKIEITDSFLGRVVPAIAAGTPEMKLGTGPQDLLPSFLRINSDVRRLNAETISALARKSLPQMLWTDAFQPLGNAAVEAKFADSRTYFYQGKEIDHQTHLGFDLAVTAHIPVLAANRGIVVHASDLGIYGNCIILDHGLGVQSLYAHLSSIDVKVGDRVEKAQVLGKSGMTGLAGGDHLHFTVLVNGHPVNPVEWWDPKWMQDRVLRKIAEADRQ
jgi:murein DD-endopeptidase MepM/ murein hydrolase activator NlpD